LDPGTGRFISQDPIGLAGGDVNLYGYVGNSPASRTDPSGLCFDPNPQSRTTRYCVQAYIPGSSAVGFDGDDRGPNAYGGTYRVSVTLEERNGLLVVTSQDAAMSSIGGGHWQRQGFGRIEPIVTTCPEDGPGRQTTIRGWGVVGHLVIDGLPFGPSFWFEITITERSTGTTVHANTSIFPAFEVWQYTPDGAVLLLDDEAGCSFLGPLCLAFD
jgi:hypothetical protein